uniref:Uncharacterized protein n=1 Tax=Nelumbo nucifera TaxID=4432 RepID=A0A822ZBX6_NELNU|nr:TPA_asm: hypothetical protein HUJ06_013361 [Nelumbo nucifera]
MNGSGTSLKKLQITRSYSFLEKVEELWNHTHKENSSASTADEAFSYRHWNGECLDRVSVPESNCTKGMCWLCICYPSIFDVIFEIFYFYFSNWLSFKLIAFFL